MLNHHGIDREHRQTVTGMLHWCRGSGICATMADCPVLLQSLWQPLGVFMQMASMPDYINRHAIVLFWGTITLGNAVDVVHHLKPCSCRTCHDCNLIRMTVE